MNITKREGKGPWMLWFPAKTQQYISKFIKTKSDIQALGSWLASETDNRKWHTSIFRDHEEVVFRGRRYSKEQGKLLYKRLIETDDWEGVDLGSPVFQGKIDKPTYNEFRSLKKRK